MIDDCIQLSVDARVITAYVNESNHGVVLAKYRQEWVVWKVFRAKKAILWNCMDGQYTRSIYQARLWFVDAVDNLLPPVSCGQCGYDFDDPDAGCDTCASRKVAPPVTVGAGK